MAQANGRSSTGVLMLLVAAVIWGTAFVPQKMAMDHIQPFTFQTLRSLLGALSLFPVIVLMNWRRAKKHQAAGQPAPKNNNKKLLLGGGLSGLVLFVAINLQQFGLVEGSAGKAGFLTALYILIVPIYGLFLGHKTRPSLWLAVGIAALGLYLLSVTADFSITTSDLLLIICAFAFALQIMLVDHFVRHVSAVQLCAMQFLVCGLLSGIAMFALESPRLPDIFAARWYLLFCGVLSSGVAYTLQILAQRNTPPAIASLLMSLEAVFAVIAGVIILSEVFSARELLGSGLMFLAILVAQGLPFKKATPVDPEQELGQDTSR